MIFQYCIFFFIQENEVSRLEDIIQHLKSKKREHRTSVSRRQPEKEIEELCRDVDELLQEKKGLERAVEGLHRTIRKQQQRK